MPLPSPPPEPCKSIRSFWGPMGQSLPLWGTFLTLPAFLKCLPLSADFYPRALKGCFHTRSTHPGEWLQHECSEAPPRRQCLHPVGVGTPRPASTETSMEDAQGGAPGIRVSLAGRPGPSTLDVSHSIPARSTVLKDKPHGTDAAGDRRWTKQTWEMEENGGETGWRVGGGGAAS